MVGSIHPIHLAVVSLSFLNDLHISFGAFMILSCHSEQDVTMVRKASSCSASCCSPPLLLPPTPPLRRFQRTSAGSRCPIRPTKLVNNSKTLKFLLSLKRTQFKHLGRISFFFSFFFFYSILVECDLKIWKFLFIT